MDLSLAVGAIMQSAVALTGLSIDGLEPQYLFMTKHELVADLCVAGKELQCEKYSTFSPPMSNKIIISEDLNPDNVRDNGIIFHELVKYVLFVNGKQNPNYSCEKNYALEGRIFKLQMQYELSLANKTTLVMQPEELLMMEKGSYMVWCNPNIKDPDPELPKFGPIDENKQNIF